jgi:CshA-type fibril repeat protein
MIFCGMRGFGRLGVGLVATAVGAALVLVPAGPAAAGSAPQVSSTLNVSDGGGLPSTAVAVGDGMNAVTSAPIGQVGQTGQQIVSTWDPTQSRITPGSIVTPEGWSTQYTVDGSTWSATAPSDPTTIQGVRTAGSVQSDGYASGLQVSTATGTGAVQAGSAAFSGSSGGDGWDAFATADYVLNTWHHNNSSYNLDCHLKATGASCGPVYSVSNMVTSMGATGDVVDGKVYSVVGDRSSSTYGVLCTDISLLPFTSCGYTPLAATESPGYQDLGTQTLSGTKIYSALITGELMCFDTSTDGACAGQPYALSGFSPSLWNMASFAISDSGRVFVTANHVWCIDGATGSACSGDWPVGDLGGAVHSAIPMRDTGGALDGVCMILPAGTCYDLTGAPVAFPEALATQLSDHPVGSASQVGIGSYGFSTTRQYWLVGNWGDSSNYPQCWDWTTQSACAGFATTTDTGGVRYAIRLDATNQNCAWTNGDNGVITSFDPLTGAAGCPGTDPTVVVPYSTVVPRMGCSETGRVRAYDDLTLTTPPGVSVTALLVTVKDSDGVAVPGFTGLSPDSSGLIDLTALLPADTGTHPSFEITSPNTSTVDAAAITAAVRYASDAPQLCFALVTLQDCPTLSAGQSATPTLPVSDVVVAGETDATVGSVVTPTPLSQTITRAEMGNCLGTVDGTVERTYPGGPSPFAGAAVKLIAPDSSVVATTTAASDGSYSFSNINPADYTVAVGSLTLDRTVSATETSTANFSVPVDTPTASPVSGATLQNTPASAAVHATADASTNVDLTTVQLYDPDATSWGTSVVIADEGTWTVTSGGDLRFAPLVGFTGTSTAVSYRVSDGYGTPTAGATARMTVLPILPTARPVAGKGIQGATVTLTPNGVGPKVPLADGSLKIIDPAHGQLVSSLTVAKVGTFTVNSSTGKVDFVPLGAFVGSSTAIYTVHDTLGRTATSTMTVTMTPITLSAKAQNVDQGVTTHTPVIGVPGGSVTTVPPSAAGASSVTVSGSTVTVVPKSGFSGRIAITVTVVHGTTTLTTVVVVLVRPARVAGGWHNLTARGTTIAHWSSSTGAVTYEVRVNGVLRCVTKAHSCGVAMLIGPKSVVLVTPVGHSAVHGVSVRVHYRTTACVSVGDVHFATSSAALGKVARDRLSRMSQLIAKQGFARGCLVGFTDSRGSGASNLALSKLRVNAVAGYLGQRTPHTAYSKHYQGEGAPVAPNDTSGGRASNRRVEMGVI